MGGGVMSKNIIICDIDGTIANLSHRLHYIERDPKDWDGFFKACTDDAPHNDITRLLRYMTEEHQIFLFSGRSDMVRDATQAWLKNHNVPYDILRMRRAGDHRPDHEVKADMIGDLTPDDVWLWLDDRDQVVQMARARGFRVLQVADGKF